MNRLVTIVFIVFLSFFILNTNIEAVEVPLPSYYESNKAWWMYQFSEYSDYTNTNCGPTCGGMAINYLKDKKLNSSYHTIISDNYPNVHAYTRWYYCQGYLETQGDPDYKEGYYNSDWSHPGAEDSQIQHSFYLESIKHHIIKGEYYTNVESYFGDLEDSISLSKVCICCVNPKKYVSVYGTTTTIDSHWVVVYGFDDQYIYINDPGWKAGQGAKIPKSYFKDALWGVEPTSWREIIIIDTIQADDEEIVIQPGSEDGTDVWITSVYFDGGRDDHRLRVGGWGDYYYSLLKFKIDSLPSNVNSAKIHLYSFYDGHTYKPSMYLDRVTSAWDESIRWSWANNPSYVSMNTLSAPTLDSWYIIDITDLYNGWKNGAYENHGIQLRPANNYDAMNAFYSSDYTDDPSLRPKLVLQVSSATADSDGDGLPDQIELAVGTNPNDADTDDDGLVDGNVGSEDLNVNGIVDSGETNPLNPDTDNDGILDGTERGLTDPETEDTDISTGFFIPDADPATTTDPTNPDTDGDGILDGEEDSNQNGKHDQGETSAGVYTAEIDIKPNTYPNCFNQNEHGVIPVAVFGNDCLDVTNINLDSLLLQGLAVKMAGKSDNCLVHTDYVNDDNYLDLVIQFADSDDWLTSGNDTATLTGELADGTYIEGSDSICIVP